MTTHSLTALTYNRTLAPASLRLTVLAGQTIRLPDSIQRIAVIAGNAWVTISGDDIVLHPGDTLSVENRPYPVILSAERQTALTLECWQE